MTPATQRRLRFLLGFAGYFVALWVLWDTAAIYPLKLFVVLLHEVSHGLAAVATGGSVRAIGISPNEGGVCLCPGGNAFLTLSAGYLGSLLWGGGLLEASHLGGRGPRVATALVGVALVTLAALLVRNWFGIVFAFGFGLALVAAARFLPSAAHTVILTVLGLTSGLYALLDIKSDVLDRPWLRSDARMLAELTGVPTLVWGALWIAVALAVSWWLLRRAMRRA